MRTGAKLLLLSFILGHVFFCPYTKVEESFNLQAIHDTLFLFPNVKRFDHMEFPGVVPRTFVGAFFVSLIALPFKCLTVPLMNVSKLSALYIVRGVLGTMCWVSFSRMEAVVSRVMGADSALWLTLLTASQFHLPFYMSRPLPNTFALILSMLALGNYLEVVCPPTSTGPQPRPQAPWLTRLRSTLFSVTPLLSANKNALCCIAILVLSTVVFRCDTAIFFAPLLVSMLLSGRLSILHMVVTGFGSMLLCLTLSVPLDSWVWGRALWPEGEVFWFNTVRNQSHLWGVMPFHWYFSSALPRALLLALPLQPLGLVSLEPVWKLLGLAAGGSAVADIKREGGQGDTTDCGAGDRETENVGGEETETVGGETEIETETDLNRPAGSKKAGAGTRAGAGEGAGGGGIRRRGPKLRDGKPLTKKEEVETQRESPGVNGSDGGGGLNGGTGLLSGIWAWCCRSVREEAASWWLAVPTLCYLVLYSFLPHKELRFVFPALPALNIVSARGAAKLWAAARRSQPPHHHPQEGGGRGYPRPQSRLSHLVPRLVQIGCILGLLANLCASAVFTTAASLNYPGGHALTKLYAWHDGQETARRQEDESIAGETGVVGGVAGDVWVHVDVTAAMTGVSRFGERREGWRYSKEEGLQTAEEYCRFNYLLTADPLPYSTPGLCCKVNKTRSSGIDLKDTPRSGSDGHAVLTSEEEEEEASFEVIVQEDVFDRVKLSVWPHTPGWKGPLQFLTHPGVYVLRRRSVC